MSKVTPFVILCYSRPRKGIQGSFQNKNLHVWWQDMPLLSRPPVGRLCASAQAPALVNHLHAPSHQAPDRLWAFTLTFFPQLPLTLLPPCPLNLALPGELLVIQLVSARLSPPLGSPPPLCRPGEVCLPHAARALVSPWNWLVSESVLEKEGLLLIGLQTRPGPAS